MVGMGAHFCHGVHAAGDAKGVGDYRAQWRDLLRRHHLKVVAPLFYQPYPSRFIQNPMARPERKRLPV
jgi:hypothetical protein